MEEVILDFTRYLRAAGVRVSLPETMECLEAIRQLGVDKDSVFTAMSATLIKRQRDRPVLEKLFRLYFSALKPGEEMDEVWSGRATSSLLVPGVVGGGLGLSPIGGGTVADRLVSAVMEGDLGTLSSIAAYAVNASGPLKFSDACQVQERVRQAQVTLEWFMAMHRLQKMHERGELREGLYHSCLEQMAFLEQEIRDRVEEQLVREFGTEALLQVLEQANPYRKDFISLTKEMVPEMRRYVHRIARQLASRPSRRLRPMRRGRIDLRRTVRRSLRTGGVPLVLEHRDQIPVRPDLVLLCDISGSVALFSQFMLQLVYTVQRRYRRVRSFVFVDRLEEVSEWFRRLPLPEALDKIRWESRSSLSGLSDFGRVFAEFRKLYLSLLNQRTTIVILGDARNNWRPPQEEALKVMAGRAQRVLWLNPVPQAKWTSDDSIIKLYAPFCTKVLECRNLEQLEKISRSCLV